MWKTTKSKVITIYTVKQKTKILRHLKMKGSKNLTFQNLCEMYKDREIYFIGSHKWW